MRLDGSCQCGKVRFRVDSTTPYPYMLCYCSICRKTSGAVTSNVMGRRDTLEVTGKRHLRCHHAIVRNPGRRPVRSRGERWFCGRCGTHLYVLDDRWPEGVWPNAAALDTPLPVPPEYVQIMTRYRPRWVPAADTGPRHPEYPPLSIAAWHERHGLTIDGERAAKSVTGRSARRTPRTNRAAPTGGRKRARRPRATARRRRRSTAS
jgi:hypothetical protein